MVTSSSGIKETIDRLRGLTRRELLEAAWREWGNYKGKKIQEYFDTEADPQGTRWHDLSPYTWARKKSSKILTETGALRKSIRFEPKGGVVFIKSDIAYARTHNFGSAVKHIPQREFVGFTEEDRKVAEEIFRRVLRESFSAGSFAVRENR